MSTAKPEDLIVLHPMSYYHMRFPQGYHMAGLHAHTWVEVMYIESGQCRLTLKQSSVELRKGDLIFLQSECAHRIELQHGDCRILNMEFQAEIVPATCHTARRLDDLPELLPLLYHQQGYFVLPDEEMAGLSILKSLLEEVNLKRWGSTLLIQYQLWALLILVERLRRRLTEEKATSGYIRKVKDYLKTRYADPVNLAEVAQMAGISRNYLHKLFRQEVGCTPNDYLQRIRLERAQVLLVKTDMPLAMIALHVGFSSQQHLHALFRTHLGITPRQYRQGVPIVATETPA
jgi:AraC-like DNA-binding protein